MPPAVIHGSEALFRRHIHLAHLPDVIVVLAEADGLALSCHGGEPDDRALACLAVDFGQHDVGVRAYC
jgi:hypothetical protein